MIASTMAKAVTRTTGKSALPAEDQRNLDEFERLRDFIRDRTRSVAERYQNGCYLVGRPGTSKTHTVIETLEALDAPWTYRNGRMTPMGLYRVLEEHPEHTIVLDDVPTLLKQEQALQILMAAMGGKPGKSRVVTYAINDNRRSFDFSGGIIAISNVALRRDPCADAVASRVPLLEHEPTDEMIVAFMRRQAIRGCKGLTPKECREVVEFVIAESRANEYRLDLRSMEKGWQDYRLCKDGKAKTHWTALVRSSMKKIVVSQAVMPVTRAGEEARLHDIAKQLLERFPGRTDKQQRDEAWTAATGKSPDVLYRHGRKLRGMALQ